MNKIAKIIASTIFLLFSGFANAAFNLAIEANPNSVRPGETIYVNVTVTNTGGTTSGALTLELNIPAHIFSFTEDLISNDGDCPSSACETGELITWNLGNLPAGSGVVVSMPATVLSGSSSPADGTGITFNAKLFENNSTRATDSQVVTVQSVPALTLSVDAEHNSVANGDTLVYNLTYGNRKQASALDTVLRFPIPVGTSFVSATGGATVNGANDEVTWQLGTLQGFHGGKQEVTLLVGNIADGSLLKVETAELDAQIDQINHQVRASSVTRIEEGAPLTLALVVNPDPALPGELLQAKLMVTNKGASTLFDVILTLRVPDHVFSFTEGLNSNGGDCPSSACEIRELVTWNLGNLPAGSGVVVSMPATVLSSSNSPLGGTLIQFSAAATAGIGFSASVGHTVVVEPLPALTLSVEASDNTVAIGDTLTYSLTYGNRKQASALNVALRFPLPAGTSFVSATKGGTLSDKQDEVIWQLEALQGFHGGKQEVTLVVGNHSDGSLLKVDAAILDAQINQIDEQARATSVSRVEEGAPLALSLIVNPDPALPGELLQAKLMVTNQGASTLFNVRLTLRVPDHVFSFTEGLNSKGGDCPSSACEIRELVTWNLGNLSAGSGLVVSMPATVLTTSNSPVGGTLIQFSAEASAGVGFSASADHAVVVESVPALTLSVEASDNTVAKGELLTYSLSYGNRKQASALNAALRFPLPAGTSFVSATGSATLSANNEVLWQLGTLSGFHGGTQEVTLLVGDLADGSLLNVDAAILDAQIDQINEQARATSVSRVEESAPLALALVVNPDPALPGELLQAKLMVANHGASTLFDVILTLRVPDHVFSITEELNSKGGDCPGSACEVRELVTWNLGNLPAGSGFAVSMPATVLTTSNSPIGGTLIQFSAEASAGLGFAASAGHTVIVESLPALTLSVEASDNTVAIGDTLTYSLTYGNRKQASALNVALRFPLPAGTSFVSATEGGALNDRGDEVIWQLDALQGFHGGKQEVSLVVESHSGDSLLKVDAAILDAQISQIEEQARATSVSRIEEDAPLALALVVNPDPALLGELLQAKLMVTNQSASTLFGVKLTLRVPDHVFSFTEGLNSNGGDCPSSACEEGELVTWDLGDFPAGFGVVVSMPATVLSGSNSPTGGTLIQFSAEASAGIGFSTTAEHAVVVESIPALTLSVEASDNTVAIGDTLTYTLTYGNRKQSSASNAVLRFPLPEGTSFVSTTGGGVLNDTEDEILWDIGSIPGFFGGRNEVELVIGSLTDGSLLKVDAAILNAEVNQIREQARATTIARVKEESPLELTLTVNPNPVVSEEVLLTELSLTNQGATTLFDVVLSLRVPDYVFSFAESQISGGGDCPSSFCEIKELVIWNLGDLPAGAAMVVSVPAAILSGNLSPVDGTLIRLSASASASGSQGTSQSATALVNPFTDNDLDGNPDVFDQDDDNGGVPDYWEIDNGFNPFSSADDGQDTDNDGFTNIQEWMQGTNPHDPDTDNDGIPDGDDPSPLTGECSGSSVVIQPVTFNSGVEFNCNAPTSITTQGNVVTKAGADIFFGAPVIRLKPGFSVQAGGTFRSVAN